jgi:small subunit ribosomal protein S6
MRDYELICIFSPDLDETALNDLVTKVKGWITDSGGEIAKVEMWGKRKLAYVLRKQKEGQYVFIKASMEPRFCAELERTLRFTEPVLRFLLTTPEN